MREVFRGERWIDVFPSLLKFKKKLTIAELFKINHDLTEQDILLLILQGDGQRLRSLKLKSYPLSDLNFHDLNIRQEKYLRRDMAGINLSNMFLPEDLEYKNFNGANLEFVQVFFCKSGLASSKACKAP